METSATEPSDHSEILRYLRAEHKNYKFDQEKYGHHLANISLLAVAGPTAAGKSTLVREVSRQDEDIHELTSTMSRPRASRDEPHHHTDVPMSIFEAGVRQRTFVNYFVNDTDHVYGTFPEGFTAPITIGAIGADHIPQLLDVFDGRVNAVYPLMSGSVYASRLGMDRINDPTIVPRLKEGRRSLQFARDNLDATWVNFVELDNLDGSLQRAAREVIHIAYHNTHPILTEQYSRDLIEEMDAVIVSTMRRLGVQ